MDRQYFEASVISGNEMFHGKITRFYWLAKLEVLIRSFRKEEPSSRVDVYTAREAVYQRYFYKSLRTASMPL